MVIIGKVLNIQWTSTDWLDPDGNPLPLKIELSRDGGGTWATLTASTTDDGSFLWTVTGPAADDCLLRFSDPADATVNFVSESFAIKASASMPARKVTVIYGN